MSAERTYNEGEIELIINRRMAERAREERDRARDAREGVIQAGFEDLRARADKANNLKVEILDRLNQQDVAIEAMPQVVKAVLRDTWTSGAGRLIAFAVTVSPLVAIVVGHLWK